ELGPDSDENTGGCSGQVILATVLQ
ncbi:TPA: adhesin, partial [Escherichia coli]|nr:adhesin [Escherichia coli]